MLAAMVWVKVVVLILMVLIIGSMISALVSMMRDKGRGSGTVKALTLRVVLSIAAFLLLIISYLAGWIQPHGIVPM